MQAATSPPPDDRSKRHKGDDNGEGMPPYGQGPMPPQQRYPPPPYGGGPPMPPQGPGYMGWGGGPPPPQYGNPPPHQWGAGPPPGAGGPIYRGPMSPDRSWNGYRKSSSRKTSKKDDEDDRQQPPPPGYGGWSHPQQFHHYGGGGWQGGAPMQPMYASQGTWTGSKSPPRGRRDIMRYDRADIDLSYMASVARGGPQDDDGASSSAGGSNKDKGRGSYKCGRVRIEILSCLLNVDSRISYHWYRVQCGVPKKGHVCPYQPKLKRRPDEPPPVLRNAAVQVEMDEVCSQRQRCGNIWTSLAHNLFSLFSL